MHLGAIANDFFIFFHHSNSRVNIPMQAYCLKEKKKMKMNNPVYSLNKIGRAVAKGTCQNGHVMFKILGKDEIPADLAAKAKNFPKGGRKSSGRKSKSGRGHKSGSAGRRRRSSGRRHKSGSGRRRSRSGVHRRRS
jgi:hypothetical protein